MTTTIPRARRSTRDVMTKNQRRSLRRALLACGLLYPATYVVANDVVAATIYDGYNRLDQAISELSSTDAESRAFLNAMLPLFTLLVSGFGVGVWKAAEGNRALRVTGGILVAQGLIFPLWLLFPMTSREVMVEGPMETNDIGHLVLGALAITLILAEMGSAAAPFGRGFRIFTLAMAASALLCGALTGVMSSEIASGGSTRWMGAVERVSYGAWLAWMAALSIKLLRAEPGAPALASFGSTDSGVREKSVP